MPAIDEKPWFQPAAELMAREGLTLAEAATRLSEPITKIEASSIFRTKIFQRLLRAERLRYHAEVGRDPDWGKSTAMGILIDCAQKLFAEGQFDKAAEVILKATKLAGWLGNDTQVTVFNGLTAKDFEKIRANIRASEPGKSTN